MDTVYKFLLWVICSFVGLIFLGSFIPNKVVFSFCVSLIIGFASTMGDN